MKKVITLFLTIIAAIGVFAQTPQAISYQAVARNSEGQVLANTNVSMRISILQGSETGNAVYIEEHNITTNQFGLITLQIGKGTAISGLFNTIDWGANRYFAKIEIDITGGTNYQEIGISEMLSVPYALYAKTAETTDYDNLTNKPILFSGDYFDLANVPTLFSGSYNDLTDKPNFFNGNYSSLMGIPTFATVATSGNYADLTNRPILFDSTWNAIKGKPDFSSVAKWQLCRFNQQACWK